MTAMNVDTPASPNTTFQSYARFELQATFALNRIAISMMEKSCFEHAYASFKGAVTTLQIATDRPNCMEGHCVVRDEIRAGLDLAASLQQSGPMFDLLQLQNPFAPSLHVVNHYAITTCPSLSSPSTQNFSSDQGRTPFTLITIDENDESLYSRNSISLITAIILHNFGISILCMNHYPSLASPEMISSLDCSRFADDADAITILQLAQELTEDEAAMHSCFHTSTTFENQCSMEVRANTSTTPPNPNDGIGSVTYSFRSFPFVIFLKIIVLQTLQKTYELTDQNDQAFACVIGLTHLRTVASVLKDESCYAPYISVEKAAPAA